MKPKICEEVFSDKYLEDIKNVLDGLLKGGKHEDCYKKSNRIRIETCIYKPNYIYKTYYIIEIFNRKRIEMMILTKKLMSMIMVA